MKTKKKLFYLSLGFSFLLLTVFSSNALGVHIPGGGGGGGGFWISANNGVKLYGGSVFGDYTDTHTRNDEYYGGYTKDYWGCGIISLKLEFPYSYTWKADHVLFYVKMSTFLYSTQVGVYYTNGGSEDVTYIASSNGYHTITFDTDLEVAYIIFTYELLFMSGWMKIDFIQIYYFN